MMRGMSAEKGGNERRKDWERLCRSALHSMESD